MQILVHKIVNDIFLKILFKIHDIMGDPQLRCHPSGIFHSAQAAAPAVFLHLFRILILPDLHGDAHDLISLFLQKPCSHRRIYSAGHADDDFFPLHT